jgi:hypothetical protein
LAKKYAGSGGNRNPAGGEFGLTIMTGRAAGRHRVQDDGINARVAENMPGDGGFDLAAGMNAEEDVTLAQALDQDMRARGIHTGLGEEVGNFPAVPVRVRCRHGLPSQLPGAGDLLLADLETRTRGDGQPAADGVGHGICGKQNRNFAAIDLRTTQADQDDIGVEPGIGGSDNSKAIHWDTMQVEGEFAGCARRMWFSPDSVFRSGKVMSHLVDAIEQFTPETSVVS